MPTSRKVLCGVYVAIALVAAVATWSQVGPYTHSLAGPFVTFWQDTKVNSASRFAACDLVLLAMSVSVLMVIEARKHDVKFVWAYVIGGILAGISITVPLFLLARELKLGASPAPRLRLLDIVLFVAVGAVGLGLVLYIDLG